MRSQSTGQQQRLIRFITGILLLCLTGAVVVSAAAQSPSPTPTAQPIITIKVGADQAYPPYEYLHNGLPAGFNIELIQAAAEAMGMQVEFTLGPWSDIRNKVLTGELDALAGFTYSPSRDLQYDFTVPHTKLTFDIFSRPDSGIAAVEDLAGKTVIVQAGGIMDDYLAEQDLPVNVIRVNDPLEALILINSGQYDAALLNKLQGLYFIDEMNLRNVEPAGVTLLSLNYSFAVREGNTALVQSLNAGLDILKQNGTYDALVEKHYGVLERTTLWESLRYYILGIGIALSLLAIAMAWVWTLRRLVYRRSQELRQSELKYRLLVENANEGVAVLYNGMIVLANPHTSRLLGVPVGELRGQQFGRFIHPDDLQMVTDLYQQRLTAPPDTLPDVSTFRMITLSGAVLWTEVKAVLIDWEGKQAVLVLFHDINDRMADQQELEENEQRWRMLYDEAPLPYQTLGPDGTIMAVNDAWLTLFGYVREDVIGQPFESFLVADSRQTFTDGLPSLFKDKGVKNIFVTVVINSGEERILSVHSRPVDRKSETHLHCVLTDITASRAAEEALRSSEEKFSRVFRTSPDSININRLRDGMYLEINDGFTRLPGYTQADVAGKTSLEIAIWADPADRDRLVQGLRATGTVHDLEARFRLKDGSLKTGLMSAKLIEVNGEPSIISITHDITDRKRAEERVERQLRYLETLRRVDLAITASIDLKLTLQLLLEQVTTHLQVDAGDILLLDPATSLLRVELAVGFRKGLLQGTTIPLGQGYAGQVALTRRTIHDFQFDKADASLATQPDLLQEAFVSYFAIPLVAKNLVVGVLELYHRRPIEHDSEWMTFLDAMAGQAALAIDNSRLFSALQRANMDLTMAYDATIEGWARALELRDGETKGHSLRVTALVIELARRMGLHGEALVHIRRGALLHDIGKMAVPDNILLKNGELTDEEWEVMRRHPVYAYDMLSEVQFLRSALDIPYGHHEHWDGSGYPRGLAGEAIPLSARIFTVVDAWDALTSDRPYRKAWPRTKVLAYLREHSGTIYDPKIVEIFLQMLDELPPSMSRLNPEK